MKSRVIVAGMALALTGSAFAQNTNKPAAAPAVTAAATNAPVDVYSKEMKEKVSYAVGMHFGNQLKRSDYDFDLEIVRKAMSEVLAGTGTKLTDAEAQSTLQTWQGQLQTARGEKNRKEGEAFLKENAQKPGIQTTASGLQYQVITEGKGKTPSATDTVRVHYRGKLINGTEFDSSHKRGQPAEFPVGGVIKGWTEALQLMKEGSKWNLFIPSHIAYGERGNANIPPNATLIFEVELIEVKEPPQAQKKDDSVQAVSGEIIKVPSAEELKKGAKIEVLKEEDVKRMLATNAAATNVTGKTNATTAPKK